MAEGAAIDDLVLWAVPARGRTLLRELRVFARLNATEVDASDALARPAMPEPPPLADGSLEVGGFLLDAETVTALEALDLTKLALPGAAGRRVLMLERDGIDVDRRLREHLESAGAEVTRRPRAGLRQDDGPPPAGDAADRASSPPSRAGSRRSRRRATRRRPAAGDAPETAELAHRRDPDPRDADLDRAALRASLGRALRADRRAGGAASRAILLNAGRPAADRPGAALGRARARLGGARRADPEDRPRGARRLRRRLDPLRRHRGAVHARRSSTR